MWVVRERVFFGGCMDELELGEREAGEQGC